MKLNLICRCNLFCFSSYLFSSLRSQLLSVEEDAQSKLIKTFEQSLSGSRESDAALQKRLREDNRDVTQDERTSSGASEASVTARLYANSRGPLITSVM